MFKIEEYIDKLIIALKDVFAERLMYIGLQGSYLRHEETEASDIDNLPVTCKSVFFIMQHLYYISSGKFIPTKRELLECVQGEDKMVLEWSMSLQDDNDYDFDRAFSVLFHWCQNALSRL